jgi:hypothetical protein
LCSIDANQLAGAIPTAAQIPPAMIGSIEVRLIRPIGEQGSAARAVEQ